MKKHFQDTNSTRFYLMLKDMYMDMDIYMVWNSSRISIIFWINVQLKIQSHMITLAIMKIRTSEAVFKYHGFAQSSPLGSLGLCTLNLFPNGLKPKPIRHTGMFCAAAHHELKMLWIWLQLLAFVTQLVSFLLFPISFFPFIFSPCSIYPIFSFISKSFSGFKLLFLCQSLLSDTASLALSVCWTTILLIPLVMVCIGRGIIHHHWVGSLAVLYPLKQGLSTICWQHFQSLGGILDF